MMIDVKEGWEEKTLGELFEITSSKRVFQNEWTSNGIPFYRAREIVKLAKHGFVDNELYISEEMYNKYSKKYGAPKEGDIMVTGVGTLGICYVVKKHDNFYFKDGNIIWLKNLNLANSAYVEYAFKSDLLRKQIDDSIGATVGTYTIIKAKSTKLPLPPLPEQQRIVSILDEAFAAIAQVKANAERNLKNAKELFESYLQGVFEEKKADWEHLSLGEVCKITDGTHFSPKNESSGDYMYVTAKNIKPYYIDLTKITYISEKAHKEIYARCPVKKGDVLYIKDGATAGIATINNIEEEFSLLSSVALFKCSPKILNSFLVHYMNSSIGRKNFLGYIDGAAITRLTLIKLKNVCLFLPPMAEQLIIVRKLDVLSKQTQKLESIYKKKIADLEELKKSLLEKAFKGELRIQLPTAKVIEHPAKIAIISAKELQAGIVAFALQRHLEQNKANTFKHVKAEKIVHLVEQVLNIDLDRNPVKDAAGPNDFPHAKRVEFRAQKAGYFYVKKGDNGYEYTAGSHIQSVINKTEGALHAKVDKLTWLVDLLIPMNTQQAEIVATVYAAWNNLLLDENFVDDEAIVTEARENWHPDKLKIERSKFFNAITWMKSNGLIPLGSGKSVLAKQAK